MQEGRRTRAEGGRGKQSKAELGHLRRLSLICVARVKERWYGVS